MMKKRFTTLLLAVGTSAAMAFTSFAGAWKLDANGRWYQNDDGSYPANCWQWIDDDSDGIAECFCFDGNGYVLMNTASPDGYMLNANGEWIVDGMVQTQSVSSATAGTASAETADSAATLAASAQIPKPQTVQSDTDSTSTVWLSATGSKYHRINNCGRMNPSKAREVSLSDARASGYEACSKCY